MNIRLLILIAVLPLSQVAQSATPLLTARCEAPKGINLATHTEADRWNTMPVEVFDKEAGGYVSHPRKTSASLITLHRDGTATQTDFLDDGRSITNNLHLLDDIRAVRSNHLPLSPQTLKDIPISLVYGGQGAVSVLTLYPKEAVIVFSGAGYFGIHKGLPVGFVETAHCALSWT
jgi:hypothetical protein